MKYILYLILVFLFVSCGNPSKLNDTWLPGGYKIDHLEYRPLYTILKIDTSKIIAFKQNLIDTTSYEFINGVAIFNFSDTVPAKNFNVENNLLYWKEKKNEKLYFRCKETDFDSDVVKTVLINNFWKSRSDSIWFDSESSVQIKDKRDRLYHKLCLDIIEQGGKIFLRKSGNHLGCKKNYHFLEQVIDISNKYFTVIRWEDNEFRKVKYEKFNNTSEIELTSFQMCDSYLYKNYPNHRYYATRTKYNGGLYAIRKAFNNSYEHSQTNLEDGIIRIRFVVSCEGKTGRFEMLELDNDYQKKKFNNSISEQILTITKDLNNWSPGEWNGRPVDSFKFLTFKIKDNRIVEIFP